MSEDKPDQTILIVDDDKPIRQLLSVLLGAFGTVELAENGTEALEKANELIPDLIVLDGNMPDLDGFAVCEKLKNDEKTGAVPIVFLTADGTNDSEERALDIGATDFVRKPISAKILVRRVSNILKLQGAMKELERLASTDSLTGAFNRRHFLKTGNAELHRSHRYNTPFTVLMLDIDHFKSVNDTYGHAVGDDALKATVATINNILRTEDTLGRLGGEEFAVLFPQTERDAAALVAERIRTLISEIVIKTEQGPLQFTMSIGVSDGNDADGSIEDSLARADQALYQAKETGRDRVICA